MTDRSNICQSSCCTFKMRSSDPSLNIVSTSFLISDSSLLNSPSCSLYKSTIWRSKGDEVSLETAVFTRDSLQSISSSRRSATILMSGVRVKVEIAELVNKVSNLTWRDAMPSSSLSSSDCSAAAASSSATASIISK